MMRGNFCHSCFEVTARIALAQLGHFTLKTRVRSGAGTFFGQGGLKIVRSCQRLGGEAPQTPLFFERTFLRAGHSVDLF